MAGKVKPIVKPEVVVKPEGNFNLMDYLKLNDVDITPAVKPEAIKPEAKLETTKKKDSKVEPKIEPKPSDIEYIEKIDITKELSDYYKTYKQERQSRYEKIDRSKEDVYKDVENEYLDRGYGIIKEGYKTYAVKEKTKEFTPGIKRRSKGDKEKLASIINDDDAMAVYKRLSESSGFKNVSIAEFANELGVDAVTVGEYLKKKSNEGDVVPTKGDWSLSSDIDKEFAVNINNTPHLLFHFKDKKPETTVKPETQPEQSVKPETKTETIGQTTEPDKTTDTTSEVMPSDVTSDTIPEVAPTPPKTVNKGGRPGKQIEAETMDKFFDLNKDLDGRSLANKMMKTFSIGFSTAKKYVEGKGIEVGKAKEKKVKPEPVVIGDAELSAYLVENLGKDVNDLATQMSIDFGVSVDKAKTIIKDMTIGNGITNELKSFQDYGLKYGPAEVQDILGIPNHYIESMVRNGKGLDVIHDYKNDRMKFFQRYIVNQDVLEDALVYEISKGGDNGRSIASLIDETDYLYTEIPKNRVDKALDSLVKKKQIIKDGNIYFVPPDLDKIPDVVHQNFDLATALRNQLGSATQVDVIDAVRRSKDYELDSGILLDHISRIGNRYQTEQMSDTQPKYWEHQGKSIREILIEERERAKVNEKIEAGKIQFEGIRNEWMNRFKKDMVRQVIGSNMKTFRQLLSDDDD